MFAGILKKSFAFRIFITVLFLSSVFHLGAVNWDRLSSRVSSELQEAIDTSLRGHPYSRPEINSRVDELIQDTVSDVTGKKIGRGFGRCTSTREFLAGEIKDQITIERVHGFCYRAIQCGLLGLFQMGSLALSTKMFCGDTLEDCAFEAVRLGVLNLAAPAANKYVRYILVTVDESDVRKKVFTDYYDALKDQK